MNLYILGLRALILTAGIGAVLYLGYLITQPSIWKTDPESTDEEKLNRVQQRGTFVSLVSAILLSLIGILMVQNCVHNDVIEVYFGFLLAPVIGYVLDIGVGTDDGFRFAQQGRYGEWMRYMFASLWNFSFVRFVLTFVLDMFISKPLSAILKGYTLASYETIARATGLIGRLDEFIRRNLTSIVQSIVAFITFQSYTNQTRFLWAYPDDSLPPSERISSSVIMLAVAIASVVYLYMYREDNEMMGRNILLVISSFLTLTLLQFFNQEDAPTEEEDEPKPQWWFGLLIFTFFLLIGLVFPFASAQCKSPVHQVMQRMQDPLLNQMDPLTRYGVDDPIARQVYLANRKKTVASL